MLQVYTLNTSVSQMTTWFEITIAYPEFDAQCCSFYCFFYFLLSIPLNCSAVCLTTSPIVPETAFSISRIILLGFFLNLEQRETCFQIG